MRAGSSTRRLQIAYGGVNATLRDWTLSLANGGAVGGQLGVILSSWISTRRDRLAAASTPATTGTGYVYQTWIMPGDGQFVLRLRRQFVFVDPDASW
jgi:hypothetical protein